MERKKYKTIKKMVKKFISENGLRIVIYFALLFLYLTDSIIALIVYSITIHMIIPVLIWEIYGKKSVAKSPMWLVFMFIEGHIFAFVMLSTDCLYTFFITTIYVVVIFIEILRLIEQKVKLKLAHNKTTDNGQ